MFDPAAMATLLIGLDIEQSENRAQRRRRSIAAPRRGLALRVRLARGLRWAASMLERPAALDVADQGC